MKIYLDECVDWRLSRSIPGHEVTYARQMGWTGVKNGEFLRLLSGQFEVFVTVDRSLMHQQNLAAQPFAIIVLCARTNRLADLLPLVPDLLATAPTAPAGVATMVGESG